MGPGDAGVRARAAGARGRRRLSLGGGRGGVGRAWARRRWCGGGTEGPPPWGRRGMVRRGGPSAGACGTTGGAGARPGGIVRQKQSQAGSHARVIRVGTRTPAAGPGPAKPSGKPCQNRSPAGRPEERPRGDRGGARPLRGREDAPGPASAWRSGGRAPQAAARASWCRVSGRLASPPVADSRDGLMGDGDGRDGRMGDGDGRDGRMGDGDGRDGRMGDGDGRDGLMGDGDGGYVPAPKGRGLGGGRSSPRRARFIEAVNPIASQVPYHNLRRRASKGPRLPGRSSPRRSRRLRPRLLLGGAARPGRGGEELAGGRGPGRRGCPSNPSGTRTPAAGPGPASAAAAESWPSPAAHARAQAAGTVAGPARRARCSRGGMSRSRRRASRSRRRAHRRGHGHGHGAPEALSGRGGRGPGPEAVTRTPRLT